MLLAAGVRLRRLDILRGVAVVLVLFRHHLPPRPDVAAPVRVVGQTLMQVGWIGVDLFFVLSGFLVSGLLFREYQRYGGLAIGRFLVRRGFKIYPAFYVLLVVTWKVTQYTGMRTGWKVKQRFIYEAVYLQNYFDGIWNHTWSLAVEEHFYLVLPVLLALGAARSGADRFRRVWVLLLGLCVAILMLRVQTVHAPLPFNLYLLPTHLRFDSLLWGVLLSYAFHQRDRGWLKQLRGHTPGVVLLIAVLLSPAFLYPIGTSLFLATWGLTTIALAFTLLLALALAPTPESASTRRGLAALGTMAAAIGVDSYSIYLWHMPVERWIMPWYQRTLFPPIADPTLAYLLGLAAYVATAVLLGLVLARLIERPMLALRDRLVPSRSGPVTDVASTHIQGREGSLDWRALDPLTPSGT